MVYLFLWWILLILLGLVAWPVAFHFFKYLPERGYAFIKPLCLLVVAYPFWLLTSFGLLQNTFGTIVLIVVLVALLAWGYGVWTRTSKLPLQWLRENWKYALTVELVFSLAFFAFAYYRAFNPEIQATEKPMDFMFVNSILRSAQFPPHDAWLAGYGISYYYFGYLIVALLTKLSAVPSNYAFNLGLTMVYALSATGAFGLVYNLVKRTSPARERVPYFFGILAVLLLLVVGNLEAPLESLHNANIGSSQFYQWLDVNGLADAPQSGMLVPQDNWWWWRASRVVNDHNPKDGGHIEVIDEFPSFSFLLGDLHPHVLALPFGLLALAVALNLLQQTRKANGNLFEAFGQWLTPEMLLVAVILGALGVLNTWDIVTYGFVIVGAFSLAEFCVHGAWSRTLFLKTVLFGILLMLVSYVLYLPFFLGFSSQVRGIAPNVFFRTPLHQYLMMFGLFVFVLASFIGILLWPQRKILWRRIGAWVLAIFSVPLAIVIIGMLVLSVSAELRNQVAALLDIPNSSQVVFDVLRSYGGTLLSRPGVFLLLTALLASILALVQNLTGFAKPVRLDENVIFVLLLAFTGFLLTMGVEFFYVRDTFETRMNTVFKLYFQAWPLFAVASSFGVYYIWNKARGARRTVWVSAFALIFALSLVFPVLAYPNRANDFKSTADTPTLDGTLWIKNAYPDDYAAIQWLNVHAADSAVILEANGRQYSFDDRISMATGLQTVLGWGGHELQWRGNYDEAGKREQDIQKIYTALDLNQARTLLEKYNVEYVIIGGIEREKFGLARPMIEKFGKLGTQVFIQGSVQIFQIQ